MNTRIEAGPLTFSVEAEMVNATVHTIVTSNISHVIFCEMTCLSPVSISINGHSISAINPELSLVGGMATSF